MKNYLVIGAGRGIGLSITELLRNNHQVFAVTRNSTPELEATGVNVNLLDVSKDSVEMLQGMPEELHGLVYCPVSINLVS